jgi:hypothetical protein
MYGRAYLFLTRNVERNFVPVEISWARREMSKNFAVQCLCVRGMSAPMTMFSNIAPIKTKEIPSSRKM